MAQAHRVAELAFMGFLFFLFRNVMSAISVAQVRRVAELAFMGFLFVLLSNVMSAISVAQARRVAELAFMGFLFFLLRNVMSAISVAQARRVAELAFHDIFKGGDQSDSKSCMSNAKNNPESTWKSITSLLSAGCKVR